MSRNSFVAGIMAASLLVMPVMASAQLTPESTGLAGAAAGTGLSTTCTGTDCLISIIGNVISLALGFIGIILLVMLLYAGFLWMTAGGDVAGVKAAKTMITNAVVGVIIVAVSYAITAFVLGQLATIAGDGGGGAASTGGVACSASSDCAPVTCPDGVSHAGMCVAGECNDYICS